MKRSNKLFLYFSIIFFIIGAGIILFINSLSEITFEYVRLNISPDQHIDGGVKSFRTNLFFLGMCIIGLGVFFYALRIPLINGTLRDFFGNKSIREYFYYDLSTPKWFLTTSIVVTGFGSLFITAMNKYGRIPRFYHLFGEDKLFEWMTAIFFALASLAILYSVMKIYSNRSFVFQYKNLFAAIMVFVALATFWIFGEEISWGQRIFNWETTETFEMNFQNETNMHNFFNPIVNTVYAVITFLMGVLMLIGWVRPREQTSMFFQLIFPHPSLFPSAIFLLVTSSIQGEMPELILSLFVLFYSIRLMIVAKNLKFVTNTSN